MAERHFTNKYDDIIHLPHHVSRKHPQMPLYDRAAQFSPFAALTGHGEAVKEVRRLTDQRVELDEYEKEILRGRLQYLCDCTEGWIAAGVTVEERPCVTVLYFLPDLLKEGGEYVTARGQVKKIDQYLRQLVLLDSTGAWAEIPVDEILRLDGEFFPDGNE